MKRACAFRSKFVTEQVNPRILSAWREDGRAGYPPYAAYTRLWKQQHCSQLDPYGTDSCPYRREDCALAYMKTAIDSIEHHPDKPIAYFSQLARWRGAERADNKPLARDRYTGTDGLKEGSSSLRGGEKPRPVDDLDGYGPGGFRGMEALRESLPGTRSRPWSIGELFGRGNIRPRLDARGGNEGEAGSDDSRHVDQPVPDTSPVDELGNQPPPAHQGVHRRSE